MQTLEPLLDAAVREAGGKIELCGFGVIAAAARTAQLIARHEPEQVILVGIAGAIGEQLMIGRAYDFNEVACFGIGVGSGENYSNAVEMGFRHWDDVVGSTEISDIISLTAEGEPGAFQLLTACAASRSPEDVRLRLQKLPNASAEDMEGFAVALACQVADVPLQIIRGISNVAGDRGKSHWKIADALHSAADLVTRLLRTKRGRN